MLASQWYVTGPNMSLVSLDADICLVVIPGLWCLKHSLSTKTAVVPCSWFGTDNHTFTITSEYPALGVYPPPGSKPLPARTYTSFSAAAIDTGNSRCAVLSMSWALMLGTYLSPGQLWYTCQSCPKVLRAMQDPRRGVTPNHHATHSRFMPQVWIDFSRTCAMSPYISNIVTLMCSGGVLRVASLHHRRQQIACGNGPSYTQIMICYSCMDFVQQNTAEMESASYTDMHVCEHACARNCSAQSVYA